MSHRQSEILTTNIVDPLGSSQKENVVYQYEEIGGLVIKKAVPGWEFQARVVVPTHGIDIVTDLDNYSGAN